MKNLLVYVNPNKEFTDDTLVMSKLQIDNSLALGWKREDIIVVTDFPFKYNGVTALVIGKDFYVGWDKQSSKLPVITYMLNNDMLDKNTTYWYHDWDAYQDQPITEEELELDNYDIGFTNYCYKVHWNCGVFFFKTTAKDIFNLWNEKMFERKKRRRADEKALKFLTDYGFIKRERYKIMNTTYNFPYKDVSFGWLKARKPIKVLHFHPYSEDNWDHKLPDKVLNTIMYGKNRIGQPLMSERLIKLFHAYGIK